VSDGVSPAGRILCSVFLVASVATLDPSTTRVRVSLLVLLFAIFALTRPDPLVLARRGLVALGAVVALCVPWVIAGNWPRALEVGGRASASTLIALAFAGTLSRAELPGALRALGLPADFASTVHAMLWQVGNIGSEGRKLVLARRLRGARGAIGPEILAELLVRTTARAERVDLAMQLRGANSEAAARRVGLGPRDVLVAGIALGAGIGLHLLAR
jgi:energy-coupling factor transporter transmembrane protein EcfT